MDYRRCGKPGLVLWYLDILNWLHDGNGSLILREVRRLLLRVSLHGGHRKELIGR